MHSLRSKFIVVISILIVLTLIITGAFLINQKKSELTYDVWKEAQSFSELTINPLVSKYKLYYESKSFSFFQREIQNTLALNSDIKNIQIADYEGNLHYNFDREKDRQYEGDQRKVYGDLIARLKDVKPSVKTENRIVYVIKNKDGSYSYVDKDEKSMLPISDKERVINIVYPHGDSENRVIYWVSYDNLTQRIWATFLSIIFILILTCTGGILVAILLAGKIVKPLQHLTKGVEEIAKGNLSYKVTVETEDELKTLADGFNQMSKDLEVSTKAMIEKEKISKELEIAGTIQKNLLPKMPGIPGLDVMASVTPAAEVGGDCYDFLKLDEDNYLLYVGDVTGHGVPASLVVAITNALIYTMTDLYKDTEKIIIHTNRILKAKTEPTMFVTAVLCNWDNSDKKFSYTSAGHEQIMHFKADKEIIELCKAGGMALGMLPDISSVVHEQDIHFGKEDALVIYSDGIPEAWKNEKETLGLESFKAIVKKYMNLKTSKEIHDAVLKEVYDFMGDYPQADDITLMVIKRTEK